jgi:hypothetical protein
MQKHIVKYSITLILLAVYLNRGFFISPYEIENQGDKEINSLIEWVMQFITDENNNIDEDGDLQSDCNSVKVVYNLVYQEFAQNFDLLNLYSKCIEKMLFPTTENFYLKDFCTQIDHPPQLG